MMASTGCGSCSGALITISKTKRGLAESPSIDPVASQRGLSLDAAKLRTDCATHACEAQWNSIHALSEVMSLMKFEDLSMV